MPEVKPPLLAQFDWTGGLRFDASSGTSSMVLDGDGQAGPSPMQALALGVGACMGADVVAIHQKGRQPLTALRVSLSAARAPEHPRCFTHVSIEFHITGGVPREAAERAVSLSREKYCSALLSLRSDIGVDTRIEIQP
jgi:putative redox protein